MDKLPDLDYKTANRLVMLYFLGIPVEEPYNRLIRLLDDFFDIDQSKDKEPETPQIQHERVRHYNKDGKLSYTSLIYIDGHSGIKTDSTYYNLISPMDVFFELDCDVTARHLSVSLLKRRGITIDSFNFEDAISKV